MSCCEGACETPTGRFFSKHSKRYAKQVRKGKLEKVQNMLLDGVRSGGVEGMSILDVGCGAGALHLALLAEGAASAVGVDMSEEMLGHARTFAESKGYRERTKYITGDVVTSEEIAPADITFMDKVVCCYEHLPNLLSRVISNTRGLLAISHPRDIWYARWLFKTQIFVSELFRADFRPWWHDWKRMEAMIELEGMELVTKGETAMWSVLVYRRSSLR